MKMNKLITGISMILTTILLASCSEPSVTGKSEMENDDGIPESQEDKTYTAEDSKPSVTGNWALDDDLVFEFKEDTTFIAGEIEDDGTRRLEDSFKGTWELGEDRKKLTLFVTELIDGGDKMTIQDGKVTVEDLSSGEKTTMDPDDIELPIDIEKSAVMVWAFEIVEITDKTITLIDPEGDEDKLTRIN